MLDCLFEWNFSLNQMALNDDQFIHNLDMREQFAEQFTEHRKHHKELSIKAS